MTDKGHISVKDEKGIQRLWHSVNPEHRNEQVRKVISLAAATWNCPYGCINGKDDDIYRPAVFTSKNLESAYTTDQLKIIRESHKDCYDFVGVFDAISATVSPLSDEYVYNFNHKHVGLATCPLVCNKAIEILKKTD